MNKLIYCRRLTLGLLILLLLGLQDGKASSARTGQASGAPANVEAVDLGLPSGTRWASCNVGASSPEEYGGYYSWGETEEKDDYSWNNYSYLETYEKFDGYTRIICKDIGDHISGTQYDVAHVKWGGEWRLPTKSEMDELLEYCIAEVTIYNDVKVMKFTGPSGKSVFFPFPGAYFHDDGEFVNEGFFTMCWSGDLASNATPWALAIYSDNNNWVGRYSSNAGFSVRPVMSVLPTDPRTYIDLGLPSGTKWANMNVGASRPEEYGEYFAWGETSAKDSYSWDNYMCPEATCGKSGDPVYDLVGDKADIAGTKFDAATINWGASWNMPTAKQVEELASNCYSSLVTINGVTCRKLKSRINGNEIIFPLAGARWFENFAYEGTAGYYWSSTLRQGGYVSPCRLIVREEDHGWGWSMGGENDRFSGFPIRPVMGTVADPKLTLGTNVLMLTGGESVAITYYAPDDVDLSAITWTTSDSSIATVNGEGVVTAASEGSCTVAVSCGEDIQDECLVVVGNTAGISDGHDYVDLGLPSGTLWATTNLGAGSPEDEGQRYQWGSEIIGELPTDEDAADNLWGAYWRIPSRAQIEELVNSSYTTITQISMNGVDGFLITSRINGKCIFLPAKLDQDGGSPLEGYYWSRTSSDNSNQAYELILTSNLQASCLPTDRSNALSIRPVYEGIATSSGIVVSSGDLNFGSVAIGSSRSLSFDIWNNTFEQKDILPFNLNDSDFSIDWNGGELEPNAKQLVTVTYTPTATTVATGGVLSIRTLTDSTFVSVFASSHKGSLDLTTKRNLVVWGKDGSQTTFVLNENPVVTVADGIIKVESAMANAEFSFNDILKLTYEGIVESSSSLNDIEMKSFEQANDALIFYSDSEDLHVHIVSLSGIVGKQFTVKQGSTFSLPLSQFSAGVYVISVNMISYKIAIR